MEKKLNRSSCTESTIVDGKIKFSDWDNTLPEVEVGMEYVLNTTDDEFLEFRNGKILLMTDEVQSASENRWCEIGIKRRNEVVSKQYAVEFAKYLLDRKITVSRGFNDKPEERISPDFQLLLGELSKNSDNLYEEFLKQYYE